MKTQIIITLLLFINISGYSQEDKRMSTIDFVEILNDNKEEALFYYQNNWQVLREIALKKDYIHSFQILETTSSPETPYNFILITTYANKTQYDERETHFNAIIKNQKGLKLLNTKQPNNFRKVIIRKDVIKHWY